LILWKNIVENKDKNVGIQDTPLYEEGLGVCQ